MIITENQLDEWVRGNSRDAQGVIVELVWRLLAATCPKPTERRFPLGDSIGQHGPDGLLNVELAFDPFVPEGRSFWEIGTGLDAGAKATADYSDLVKAIPKATRINSTFVFVTPLSGRRDWRHTWKEDAQGAWLDERRATGEWRDVRVIDGTKLIDWIHEFPAVELWIGQKTIGVRDYQLETPEQRWDLVRTIGDPPPLTPKLFLTNRDDACEKLQGIVDGISVQLKLETHFPDQVVDFVSAYLADLDIENRADAVGRCLIISGADTWNTVSSQSKNLILIADPALDLSGETGTKLIQKARRNGHAVIFGGPAGGIPDPASVPLRAPQSHQVQEALEHAGYNEERARTLAQKSGGNLGSLLRCLQNLSLMPEWAESTAASELAIAAMLGAWCENSPADRAVAECLSGNSYGEWIGKVRDVALRPGTPLIQRDGNWRFAARYEAWYALGPKVFDEHLQRLEAAAISVLTERDPQFDLPKEERYASSIHGKLLTHSQILRNGLAESLALVGSHPKALKSCSFGRAELTAVLAVRKILADADWDRWASLNTLLPLLAEAAPEEFLDAVEKALTNEPSPFGQLFAEEGDAVWGTTYMSGVLWALETLAWNPVQLVRVVLCIGELAAQDPGGRWSNRPSRSLTTILLPWLPQTCAPIAKRAAAVSALLTEVPEVAWALLLSLLPNSSSTSSYTRRPAWRETIPENWPTGVTESEYSEQIGLYSAMAVSAATSDPKKLAELIVRIDSLPTSAQEQLLAHVGSDAILTLPDGDRLCLWTGLADVAAKHKKFSGTSWALSAEQVDRISTVAARLAPVAPAFQYQRLFSENEYGLYDELSDYNEQQQELERRRQRAVENIAASGGPRGVLEFARTVQSPWRVGFTYGSTAGPELDSFVLPEFLESDQKQICEFTGGFVWSRFRTGEWDWVDAINTSQWNSSQIGQLLAYLPFAIGTWERSTRLLGTSECQYWKKTGANPYEATAGLETAVEKLIRHGRPLAAIRCLYKIVRARQHFDTKLAIQTLLAALESAESPHSANTNETVSIIEALQQDPSTDTNELLRIEWAYLPLLDRHRGAAPKLLEERLATDPAFFCEVIRVVFRPSSEDIPVEEPTEEEKAIAKNAYSLLREWRTPPGCLESRAFDGEALSRWLDDVKKECEKSGHLDIAMSMFGHALVHVPQDPDGLWIHRAAASALNARDAKEMRGGFCTELYNSRGAHWVDPTGTPERELAAKYRGYAESVENAGYHRFATALRELAASYDREAEIVTSSDRFRE